MDFTRLIDLISQIVSKAQVEAMFVRLSITGYSDWEVFLVWIVLSIVIIAIVVYGLIRLVIAIFRFIEGGFDL
jgi:hypothetical protein